MTEQERNLIRDAMMFAVKDITGRVMREATVNGMIDDFKKSINYTSCCKSDSELLSVEKEPTTRYAFYCWDKEALGKKSECKKQCDSCIRYDKNRQ